MNLAFLIKAFFIKAYYIYIFGLKKLTFNLILTLHILNSIPIQFLDCWCYLT